MQLPEQPRNGPFMLPGLGPRPSPRSRQCINRLLHMHFAAGTPLPLYKHFCLDGPQHDILLLHCTQVKDILLKLKESRADLLSVQSLTALLEESICIISKTLPKSSTSCQSVFYIYISSLFLFFLILSFFLGHRESPVIFLPPKYCRLVLLQNIKPETRVG